MGWRKKRGDTPRWYFVELRKLSVLSVTKEHKEKKWIVGPRLHLRPQEREEGQLGL